MPSGVTALRLDLKRAVIQSVIFYFETSIFFMWKEMRELSAFTMATALWYTMSLMKIFVWKTHMVSLSISRYLNPDTQGTKSADEFRTSHSETSLWTTSPVQALFLWATTRIIILAMSR